MNKLLVLVPSRGRPESVASMSAAWASCRTSDETVLMYCLDDDDDRLADYVRECMRFGVTHSIAPRMRLGGTLNHYALENADHYPFIGFMGDDHRPRSFGWDSAIIATLTHMKIGIAYGDDLFRGESLATAAFLTSNIIMAIGAMVPADLTHLYIDDAWMALGRGSQSLVFLPKVIVEHMHPAARKAPMDDRYAEVNSGEMYEQDGRKWHAYVDDPRGLVADVRKIIALRG